MSLAELLPFVAIAVAFWLLFIRPVRRRRSQQAKLMASLALGQRIMTTAGLFGVIEGIEGDRVRVEVAPGVVVDMLALAIAQIVPDQVVDATDPMPSTDPLTQPIVLDPPVETEEARGPGEESPRG
jgi:preprotein translocase subunit YajC